MLRQTLHRIQSRRKMSLTTSMGRWVLTRQRRSDSPGGYIHSRIGMTLTRNIQTRCRHPLSWLRKRDQRRWPQRSFRCWLELQFASYITHILNFPSLTHSQLNSSAVSYSKLSVNVTHNWCNGGRTCPLLCPSNNPVIHVFKKCSMPILSACQLMSLMWESR